MNAKSWFSLVAACALVLAALVGCQQARGQQATDDGAGEQPSDSGERAGGATAVAGAGGATTVAGDAGTRTEHRVRRGEAAGSGAGGRRVRLAFRGAEGTRFSGACTVGGGRTEVSGRVPESFVYEPDGRGLRCEIRKRGGDAGPLKILLTSGDDRYEQRIEARNATVNLAYSDGTFTVSTTTASGSVGRSQTVTSSGSSTVSVTSSE